MGFLLGCDEPVRNFGPALVPDGAVGSGTREHPLAGSVDNKRGDLRGNSSALRLPQRLKRLVSGRSSQRPVFARRTPIGPPPRRSRRSQSLAGQSVQLVRPEPGASPCSPAKTRLSLIGSYSGGKISMKRIALAPTLLAISILSAPLGAQQTSPDLQTSPAQPSPSPQQSAPDAPPPPFPPFARARPSHRWVDVGNHHTASSRHQSAQKHRHVSTEPKHKRHAREEAAPERPQHRHTKHGHHESASAEKPQTRPASKRAIRKCHKMTYSQIMREHSCRELMKQDLDRAEHRHADASRRKTRHKNNVREHNERRHRMKHRRRD